MRHGVLAEVGTIGTAPNVAIQKFLNSKQVPQLFIPAGGRRFNDPKTYPWTVPLYPDFETEGRVVAMVIGLAVVLVLALVDAARGATYEVAQCGWGVGAELDRALATARTGVDAATFAERERDGGALDMESAVALALG